MSAGGQRRPPLRMGYKGHGRRADVGIGPYGWVTRNAVERVVGDADPYGCVARDAVRRADVGSELSAASGRGSEVSEWPRSKF